MNEFRDVRSFLDYREFGEGKLKLFDACVVKGYSPNDTGQINIFLNYKPVGSFKKKADALNLVSSLIRKAPVQASKDFEEYRDTLLHTLE